MCVHVCLSSSNAINCSCCIMSIIEGFLWSVPGFNSQIVRKCLRVTVIFADAWPFCTSQSAYRIFYAIYSMHTYTMPAWFIPTDKGWPTLANNHVAHVHLLCTSCLSIWWAAQDTRYFACHLFCKRCIKART